MELIISGLRVPVENDGPVEYLKAAALRLNLPCGELELVRIISKVPVFGDQQQFYYQLSLAVRVPAGFSNTEGLPAYVPGPARTYPPAQAGPRPVIVGFGPAGMFAALELLAYGLKPLIFERGKKLEERHLDVQRFIGARVLDPESNIQFGEGGAGSYSDGKLFSRINNSPYASRVLETFIRFGAPAEIGYVSKPHLGTDVLRRIVLNVRNYILERGGEIYYGAKVTDILIAGGRAAGVVVNGSAEYAGSGVFFAPGNSARDTFA